MQKSRETHSHNERKLSVDIHRGQPCFSGNIEIKQRLFGFQFFCISFAIFSFVFGHETDHAVGAAGHDGARGPGGILVIVLGRQPLAVLLIVLVT